MVNFLLLFETRPEKNIRTQAHIEQAATVAVIKTMQKSVCG